MSRARPEHWPLLKSRLNHGNANIAAVVDKALVMSKETVKDGAGDMGYAWLKTNYAGSVRSAITCVNLSIPFRGGRLSLGTWQGIYLWEHRRHPHRRTISVHFIGE